MHKNNVFFENFGRKTRKFFKISEILVFFKKINPYNENRISEVDGHNFDKQWVVRYRALVPWLVDVHINGLLANFILAVFTYQPLHYFFILADGLTIWLIPKLLLYIISPFTAAAKEIVRELPRK